MQSLSVYPEQEKAALDRAIELRFFIQVFKPSFPINIHVLYKYKSRLIVEELFLTINLNLKVFRAYISITKPILSIILHTLFQGTFPIKSNKKRWFQKWCANLNRYRRGVRKIINKTFSIPNIMKKKRHLNIDNI